MFYETSWGEPQKYVYVCAGGGNDCAGNLHSLLRQLGLLGPVLSRSLLQPVSGEGRCSTTETPSNDKSVQIPG